MNFIKWIFGTNNNKTINNKPILQIENMTSEERAELKRQYDIFTQKLHDKIKKINNDTSDWVKKRNTICPNCSSKDISNRIQQIKGDIKGESYSSGSVIFGTGSWSSYGNINGSIDTNPINKCNNCQHEWKTQDMSYTFYHDKIKMIANSVAYFISQSIELYEKPIVYNPNNLSEKYTSAKEKEETLKAELPNSAWAEKVKEYFTDYSAELAIYIMFESSSRYTIEDISKKQTGYLRLLNLPTIEK